MNSKKPGKTPGRGTGAVGRTNPPPVRRPEAVQKRVNVDFPLWMVAKLDGEADRLGLTRQSLIKFWIGERLDRLPAS